MSLSKTAAALGFLGISACVSGKPVTPQCADTQAGTRALTIKEMRQGALEQLGVTNEGPEVQCVYVADAPDCGGPRDKRVENQSKMAAVSEFVRKTCWERLGDRDHTGPIGGSIPSPRTFVLTGQKGNVTCSKLYPKKHLVVCDWSNPIVKLIDPQALVNDLYEKAQKELGVTDEGEKDGVETKCAQTIGGNDKVDEEITKDIAVSLAKIARQRDGCTTSTTQSFPGDAPRIVTKKSDEKGYEAVVACAQLPLFVCKK